MAIDKAEVGKRLKAIRVVSGIERKEFVRRLAIGVLADWNNYEDARMLLTVQIAAKLIDLVPGLTLDWIFFGRTSGLDDDLHCRLAAAANDTGKAA